MRILAFLKYYSIDFTGWSRRDRIIRTAILSTSCSHSYGQSSKMRPACLVTVTASIFIWVLDIKKKSIHICGWVRILFISFQKLCCHLRILYYVISIFCQVHFIIFSKSSNIHFPILILHFGFAQNGRLLSVTYKHCFLL